MTTSFHLPSSSFTSFRYSLSNFTFSPSLNIVSCIQYCVIWFLWLCLLTQFNFKYAPMFASLVFLFQPINFISVFFNVLLWYHFRTNGVRQRIQPCHSCNAKLYMVPIRVFTFRSASRAFASVGSLETGVVGGDDNLSSATSTPNDFGR